MAGTINSTSVIWNVGDTTGHAPGGGTATVAIPVAISESPVALSGTAVPTAAPTGNSPTYVRTTNNKLYAWTGAAWVAISGANT